MAAANEDQILEGFLCPICKADLKSASQLTSHFESLHQEDQDVLKSLKDIFGNAFGILPKQKNSFSNETREIRKYGYNEQYNTGEEQVVGVSRSSSDYYKGVRSARLERYATETNKLLIRLDKLVCNMPSEPGHRKQHEQDVVPWLDGSSVKLCPNCAKAFNLTRRKHHCRLCGSLLCHDCSVFLDLNIARSIVDPSAPQGSSQSDEATEKTGLRLCEHCYNLIELRKQVQESRNAKTVLVTAYEQMRAQRHWGNFLFDHKEYEECIPHFEKSVEINSIQESVWMRLAYAALTTENWEMSAKAYRRYTYLQPNSFEAWNNLAKVYVKQGDKNRAYRALMESLRFNYDNWKLWENIIIVSMDTGHFEDVIRGIHRILDLQHKFEDVEVLSLLVRAIVQDSKDADGNSAARLRKRVLELFGRITSIHQNKPEIWQLYSDLSPTYLLRAQRLLKAYKGYTQSGNWSNNPETCNKVIELSQNLLDFSEKARQEAEEKDKLQADQQLSSARLTGQAVIRAAEKQNWPETQSSLEELKSLFAKVTEYMKSIM